MKKQIFSFAMAGAIALFGAGAAFASCTIAPLGSDGECVDFNLHGASAEYNFFTVASDSFLTNSMGCTTIEGPAQLSGSNNSKYGVTVGGGCHITGIPGTVTIVFRYSSKASWDGIGGITGEDLMGAGYTNNPQDLDVCSVSALNQAVGNDVTNMATANYRTYADESQCNWVTNVCGGAATTCAYINGTLGTQLAGDCNGEANGGSQGAPLGTLCAQANVGAADVAAAELQETSTGHLKGPNGGVIVTRNFSSGVNLTAAQATANGDTWPDGITPTVQYDITGPAEGDKVLVVPFSFVVNNSVTVYTCNGGANAGSLCDPGENDCLDPGHQWAKYTGPYNDGTCTSGQLENITHEQAVEIFSAQVDNWADLGPWFTAQEMVVCYRHAGSGSHATLDWTVMHQAGKQLWSVVGAEGTTAGLGWNLPHPGLVWFNDGTGDAVKCANFSSTYGAITYADSDYLTIQADVFNSHFPNVHEIAYQGQLGRHTALVGGAYDFYTTQHLYTNSTSLDISDPNNHINDYPSVIYGQLKTWLLTAGNLPPIEAYFWAQVPTLEMPYYTPEITTTYPKKGSTPTATNAQDYTY